MKPNTVDMPDPSLSSSAALLRPVARAALACASRLRAERAAAQGSVHSELLDGKLNETLARLRGGRIEAPWWSNVLARLGQEYIAPDFLRKPSLQEWLENEDIAEDLKRLATDIIMGGTGLDTERHARIAESYSNHTGEVRQLAAGPIDVVVATLVAGYIASIPEDQHPVVGMFQELYGRFNRRFDDLEDNRLSDLEESVTRRFPIIQEFVTTHAKQELSKILSLRTFDEETSKQEIMVLHERISEGDLVPVDDQVKNDIRYWTARFCATDSKTVPLAKQLTEELRSSDPNVDLSVVDALIAERDGDVDRALRLLRDADSADNRSAWFNLLKRVKSTEAAMKWFDEQAERHDVYFFTAAGWSNWAICACELEMWKEASEHLHILEDHWEESSKLPLLEGIINAAMLIPPDFRQGVLNSVPLYLGIGPSQGVEAEKRHARATTCFNFTEQSIRDFGEPALIRFVDEWILWLRMMNPRPKDVGELRNEITLRMRQGPQAVKTMPFAYAFEVEFDSEPLERYLKERKNLGGLDNHEVLAECLVSERSMTPRELISYLEQNESRLTQVIAPQLLAAMHVNAVVEDGQSPEKAREIVEKYGGLDKDQSDRLAILIEAGQGKDPRPQLEERYQQTGSIVDLRNLIVHLKSAGDREALRPLLRTQFSRERNAENALDFVICLSDPANFDHESIIEFLADNDDIVALNDDLQTARAVALFHAGRLEEARKTNDALLKGGTNPESLRLELRIAVASGDWERIGGILDRAWDQRNTYEAETLMAFANLAGQQGQMQERALQLARLAINKAPDNPQILAAAYWQYFKLGRDEEADPAWLLHAAELSSAEEGPIWRLDLRDVAIDWLPRRRDHLQEVERKWIDGEIPMSLAAGRFNVSLARLLLHVPEQSAKEADGRRRTVLPIVAGARKAIDVQETWTIGLDITSVLVLSYLDVLKETIDAFHHVKLAPDIMEHLFQEQDEVRFHQPSRIAAAKQVLELERAGHLEVSDGAVMAPQDIVEEVGDELAQLLQLARDDGGRVICVLPIYKPGSLMLHNADTREFEDLIISIMDFCKLLGERGRIGEAEYRRVKSFLHSQDQLEKNSLSPSTLDVPIYMDGLALRYLLDSGELQSIVTACSVVRVHSEVLEEMRALTEADDTGQGLVDSIEAIRDILRSSIEEHKASFLPRTTDQHRKLSHAGLRFEATASLLESSKAYDALCIDDRFINNHANLSDTTERSIPIICVVDVLRYLVAIGHLSNSDYQRARHTLRLSGFSFVSLEPDELVHWLREANCIDGELIESKELRILRQSAARSDSLELYNWHEAFSLTSSSRAACSKAISDLWENEDIASVNAVAMSHWIWRSLMATAIPGRRILAQESYRNLIRETLSLRIGSLLLPMPSRSQERNDYYEDWIEQSVLQPLWPANSDRIEVALNSARDAILSLDIDQAAYGNLFLASLPEPARRLLMNGDPEFAKNCGFRAERVFSIGTNVRLTDSALFRAAAQVYSTGAETSIRDVADNEVTVGLGTNGQHIIVGWLDADKQAQEVELPRLALVSSKPQTRLETLQKVIDDLGPTSTDFGYLLVEVESRQPTHEELSLIFNEASNGVAAVQTMLEQKIQGGLPLDIGDLIPQSLDYFERFAGPRPEEEEPDAYFREVLVNYRRGLLSRDLGAGLDICCLGALMDELAPGKWVEEFGDDEVWNALSLCNAEGNPFSLLGALDIAMYRLADERFGRFAEGAIFDLLDEEFWVREGCDLYRLLQVITDFIFNRISLMENGALLPKYWKRMAAWMRAGEVVRTLVRSSLSVDVDSLQKWTLRHMIPAGAYSALLDARKEPMRFADSTTPEFLHQEVFARLHILLARHHEEGRVLSKSTKIDSAMEKARGRGLGLSMGLPGPLEGYRRPSELIPPQAKQVLEQAWAEGSDSWHLLVSASQFFELDEAELARAQALLKSLMVDVPNADARDVLGDLELASMLAATNRSCLLADDIADALTLYSRRVATEQDVQRVFAIVLQAAAAYEEYEGWFQWLEERLAHIAASLPDTPEEVLHAFVGQLDEIEMITPANAWFHIRARAVALGGVM